MTAAGHWDGCKGMVLYASAASLVVASEPGGRRAMRSAMISKVPHMVGNFSVEMKKLMEGEGKLREGVRG
jgi:hypothetical protein